MTKLKEFYKNLSANVKMIIKSTLLLYSLIIFTVIFANLPIETQITYELSKFSEELLTTARSVLFVGFPGAVLLNYLEKSE